MKPKSKILSLLLAICLVVGLMPTVVFAAGIDTGKAIQLVDSGTAANIDGYDSTNGYDYIYYGTWNDSAIKWRVLDDQTNTGESGLFLLSEELLESNLSFNGSSSPSPSQDWQTSDVQAWCEDFAGMEGSSVADAFSSDECNAILKTTKSDEAFTSGGGKSFAASDNILNGDKVFFLSAEEAENSAYGFTDDDARVVNYNGKATGWWLRSPHADGRYNVGSVNTKGIVNSNYASNSNCAGRPAFNLDLNTVLFTSAANGGKPEGGLQTISDYEGDEWKLTLLDSNRQFIVMESDVSGKPGDTISLNYTGAITGQDEYISVLLTDQQNNILYYGRVAQPDNESGTVEVTIPTDLVDGTYTLNVFSEQYNGDYKTDYASEFEEITLTVIGEDKTAPILTAGNVNRDSETVAIVRFTSDEAGEYYYEVVESGADEPTIDTSGTGISCDTTEQTISFDNLLGIGAKDIYVVVKDDAGNVSAPLKMKIPAYIAPSYGISASPAKLNFGSKTVGYIEAPSAQTVTLTNTGNQDVTITLPNSTNYIIISEKGFANDTAIIAPNGTAVFTVQPITGLGVGNYDETISIVSSNNNISTSVALSFEVNPKQYLVIVDGSYAQTTGAGSYAEDATVTIDAGTRSGYTFDGWTSEDGVTFANAGSVQTTFTMPDKDVTVTANWKKKSSGGSSSSKDYFTITASARAGGSISPYGSVRVREGRDKTFTITPDSGYYIFNVLVDGKSIGAVTSYTFDDVQKKHTIEAVFARDNQDIGIDNPFTDIHPDDWFYDAISYVVENGLMSGMGDSIFSPNSPLTREMLTVILWNLEGNPTPKDVAPFLDVTSDKYYAEAIAWANENGIVAGYGDTFGVGDSITREQFAVMLHNYAQYQGYDVSVGEDTNILSYADAFDISNYAYPAMQWACGAGIINGMDDGTLMPQGKATRAETATMLMNFCENVVK
mgnify:CR=1 FL=1